MLSVCVTIAVVVVPGLLTGLAVGLRGWLLAGFTPLLSYAIAGLTGPWTAAMGVPFNPLTFAISTVVFAAVGFGLRTLTVRRRPPEPEPTSWAGRGHVAVIACLCVAAAAGMLATIRGLGRLDALPQGFDAVFHGNGIRYIADTGDGSLFGMAATNWWGEMPVFYPNAYHLLASVAYKFGAGNIPATLDANTMLLPALLGLSMVTLVRAFRGRAVLAGAAALTAVAPVTGLYESMDRGPLLPFLLGLSLTPLAAVALHRYLERIAPDTGFVLLLTGVGLLCVHSSTLFGAILFAGPLLVQRWLPRGRRIGRDLLALLAIAALSLFVAWLQLFGALGLATGKMPYWGWPDEWRASTALGALLSFQHFEPTAETSMSVALFLGGVVFFTRAGRLRWMGLTAGITGLSYIAVSSTSTAIVMAFSRPWWDDPYRFFAMATIPLSFLAAHGLAETQAWLRDKLPATAGRPVLAAALAVVVLGGFVAVTRGLYFSSNGDVVARGYQADDVAKLKVTPDERTAMEQLGKLAKPGEWAMNDRLDGTAWTYALSGVRTVAGHFDEAFPPADALLLDVHFREYATNPAVRAAVRRLNVQWVILGRPDPGQTYSPGLLGLARESFLKEVYRNPDAVIYRIAG